tara:strand:- start:14310 stop:14711 length:402 start_codon:yes stop_codon:yes gene_type:complete
MEWMKNAKLVLRIGVAGEFFGHGAFALGLAGLKKGWIPYFTALGIPEATALMLLPLIGIMDIAVGLIILFRPFKAVVAWAAAWGFLTALVRPLSARNLGGVLDFIERFANWAAPLALLALNKFPKKKGDWWKV